MRKFLPLLLLVVICVVACLSDPDERREGRKGEKLAVSQARDYFEKHADELLPTELIMPGAATRAGLLPQVVMTPLWKSASAYGADTVSVVDVPVMLSSLMLVRRGDNLPGRPETEYNLSAESRLVVTKKEGGSVEMFVTTMLPDYEYLLGRSRETRYLHDANDFSGLIIFSHLDGSPIRISEYRGGTWLRNWRIVTAEQIAAEGHEHYVSLQYKTPVTYTTRKGSGTRSSTDCDYCSPGQPCMVHRDNVTDEVVVIGKKKVEESLWTIMPPSYPKPPTYVVPDDDDTSSGGPGGGPSNPPQTTPKEPTVTANPAPYAKKLFRGNLTDAEWKRLEELIKDIMDDCAGGTLYSELNKLFANGETINFVFDPSLGKGGIADFPTGAIKIGDAAPSSTLIEEIFHYYQAITNLSTFNNSNLNREVEARVLNIKYGMRDLGYSPVSSTNLDLACYELINKMTPNGDFIDTSPAIQQSYSNDIVAIRDALKSLNRGTTPYATMNWSNETPSEAFKSLKEISKNC